MPPSPRRPRSRRHARCWCETIKHIGDTQVRNRGTIGGSLAHADPGADLPTLMMLLGAKLVATGAKGPREIGADGFFVDIFTTSLAADEIVTAVKVPGYGKGSGAAYEKHRHPASGYAVVGVGAFVTLQDGKCSKCAIAVGGATGTPVRAREAEAMLTGKAMDGAAIAAAAEKVSAALKDGMSDHYASAEYRAHLATVLAKRALGAALAAARS